MLTAELNPGEYIEAKETHTRRLNHCPPWSCGLASCQSATGKTYGQTFEKKGHMIPNELKGSRYTGEQAETASRSMWRVKNYKLPDSDGIQIKLSPNSYIRWSIFKLKKVTRKPVEKNDQQNRLLHLGSVYMPFSKLINCLRCTHFLKVANTHYETVTLLSQG